MTGNSTVTASVSPFSKGEVLSVFFILGFRCLVWRLLPFFAVPLFLGSFFEKIFGSELLFLGGGGWSCVFWWVFAYVFALLFSGSLPKVSEKILLMSGLLCFGVLSLFLWFFSSTPFFPVFFKRQRSGSHRTPLHTRLCCWFLFFLCPAAFVCFARFGRASRFLVVSRGAILGPGRFWDSP